MSATPDSTLADSERRIADLERQLAEREAELAECNAERDEALEQQTATAAVLQVINSSPGDLTPVFDAILEKAHTLCGATYGTLLIRTDETFHALTTRGYPESLVERWQQGVRPGANHPIRQLVDGDSFVHVPDLVEIEDPTTQSVVQLAGVRTSLFVPLRREGVLLGAITAGRIEVRPFSDKQIALLQNFAAQAVIAMENARLINETREALEQQTATAEVLRVINSSPGDLAPVFEAMLEKAHSLCGADNGGLHTYDGERFWPVAWHGISTQFADARSEGIDPEVAPSFGRIVRGDGLDHIHDMVKFAAQVSDEATRRRLSDLIETGGIRTQLIVALRKDDLLLGAITANRKVMRPFSEKQIALLQNFAGGNRNGECTAAW